MDYERERHRECNHAFKDHDCELELENEDDLKFTIPGNTLKVKLSRLFFSWCTISQDISKYYSPMLRSYNATIKERDRQIYNFPFRIHPYSKANVYINISECFIYLMQIFMCPLDCALSNYKIFLRNKKWSIVRTTCDLLCCFFVLIKFIRGYYDPINQKVVLESNKIAQHYLKRGAYLDIMIAIPTDWIFIFNLKGDNETLNLVMEIYTLMKILYVTKMYRICRWLSVWVSMHYYNYLVLSTIFMSLVFWHITCCFLHYIRCKANEEYFPHWRSDIYLKILFHGSSIILFSNAAQRIDTNTERVLIFFTWLLSKVFFLCLLGFLILIMKGTNAARYKYIYMDKQLSEFMHQKQFPALLQRRIQALFQYQFQGKYYNEGEIYSTLSVQLEQEIQMHICQSLVKKVIFFSHLPLPLLIRIISSLKKEIYLVNDVIIKANTLGRSMYFIANGSVAVYTKTGKELCHLRDGDYFGEVAVLTKNPSRIASVIAIEISEVYRLYHKDFMTAIKPYPDLLEEIRHIAEERLEFAMILDERNKRCR